MKKKIYLLFAVFLLSLSFGLGRNAFYASADENDATICKGVFIDEVDVSGMNREEAQAAVDSFVDGLKNKGVAISVGENLIYTTAGDLGFTYEPNDNIEAALNLGKSGNLLKRYKDLKDIENGNMVLPLTFTLDDQRLNDLIKTECTAYDVAPVNATVTRKDGEFVYTDHKVGKKVDAVKTAELVKNTLLVNWNRMDVVVEAAQTEELPQYTLDMVKQCNTVLGTFHTEFKDSSSDRASNVSNGARLINNTVLYPGEEFSAYKILTPFTVENGYAIAGAYLNGEVIDSIGGGACQVTTTLYNAALYSELEIVERESHSMVISYAELSRDAAIAGTTKNLRFKNNTDAPILIEGYTKDRVITFKIWGHEVRDTENRKVEYESVKLSETPPPKDIITKDPTQPATYKKVTQSAHIGYRAELYKVVYENGVEVSRELINSSYYAPSARRITVGTKEEKPTPTPTPTPKPNKDNKPDNNEPKDNDPIDEEIPPTDEEVIDEAPVEDLDEAPGEVESNSVNDQQGSPAIDIY